MTAPDDRPDHAEDPDERAWAELVQAFHAAPENAGERNWPAAEDLNDHGDDSDPSTAPEASAGEVTGGEVTADDLLSTVEAEERHENAVPWRSTTNDPRESSESADHFVPPQPPPLPRGDLVSRLAWAGVIVPPAVVVVAGLASIQVPTNIMAFLALAFIVGFGTLVSRLRGHHPSDPDDGAVL